MAVATSRYCIRLIGMVVLSDLNNTQHLGRLSSAFSELEVHEQWANLLGGTYGSTPLEAWFK